MSDLAYRISPSLQCLLLASSFDQNSFREPRTQLGDIVSEGAFNRYFSGILIYSLKTATGATTLSNVRVK